MVSNRVVELDADFAIVIDFRRAVGDPARVFRAMAGLVDTCQNIDRGLINAIDTRIEPVLLLEEIETDTLKTLFRTILRAIPDDALLHLDPKPILGQFLLMAKRLIINFTKDRDTITSISELDDLVSQLNSLTDQTQIKMLPAYQPIKPRVLLENMQAISSSVAFLDKEDKAVYVSNIGQTEFNLNFRLTPEVVEDLVTKSTLPSEGEMILRIKKPDFLGESMWDFRHGNTPIQATIEDKDWLKTYQSRLIDIRPQDAIKALVRTIRKYDYKDELIVEHFTVVKIVNVISGPEQPTMFEQQKEQ
jgi:hypothetical protein